MFLHDGEKKSKTYLFVLTQHTNVVDSKTDRQPPLDSRPPFMQASRDKNLTVSVPSTL